MLRNNVCKIIMIIFCAMSIVAAICLLSLGVVYTNDDLKLAGAIILAVNVIFGIMLISFIEINNENTVNC